MRPQSLLDTVDVFGGDCNYLKTFNDESSKGGQVSNNEPQNHEVFTSIFDIPCSTFCGSKRDTSKIENQNFGCGRPLSFALCPLAHDGVWVMINVRGS
jgi:hypothetical protein